MSGARGARRTGHRCGSDAHSHGRKTRGGERGRRECVGRMLGRGERQQKGSDKRQRSGESNGEQRGGSARAARASAFKTCRYVMAVRH